MRNFYRAARLYQLIRCAKRSNSLAIITSRPSTYSNGAVLLSPALAFSLFKTEEKEDPNEKLINTIKRSILCINREEYMKAEQMLHLALRMALDLQNREGITYIYDIMANLAMEQEQFKKAEKLFIDVMQRLLADGHSEDSPQMLHISSKIAHMAELQGQLDKAQQGFIWTIEKCGQALMKAPEDKDLRELLGLTKSWFGQLLIKQKKYDLARRSLLEAYDLCVEVHGAVSEAAVDILNNISVALVELENYAEAKETLERALETCKQLKNVTQEGSLKANLGLIYLRLGLLTQAKAICKEAWQSGKLNKDADTTQQAEYCLDEIKAAMSN